MCAIGAIKQPPISPRKDTYVVLCVVGARRHLSRSTSPLNHEGYVWRSVVKVTSANIRLISLSLRYRSSPTGPGGGRFGALRSGQHGWTARVQEAGGSEPGSVASQPRSHRLLGVREGEPAGRSATMRQRFRFPPDAAGLCQLGRMGVATDLCAPFPTGQLIDNALDLDTNFDSFRTFVRFARL